MLYIWKHGQELKLILIYGNHNNYNCINITKIIKFKNIEFYVIKF